MVDPHCGWIHPHSWNFLCDLKICQVLSADGLTRTKFNADAVRSGISAWTGRNWRKSTKYWVRMGLTRSADQCVRTEEFFCVIIHSDSCECGWPTRSADDCVRTRGVLTPMFHSLLLSSSSFLFCPFPFLFCGEHQREREHLINRKRSSWSGNRSWNRVQDRKSLLTLLTGISFFSLLSPKSRISRFFGLSFETEDLSWYYSQTSSVSLLIDFESFLFSISSRIRF